MSEEKNKIISKQEIFDEAMREIDEKLMSYIEENKKATDICKYIVEKYRYKLDIDYLIKLFSEYDGLIDYINSRKDYWAYFSIQSETYIIAENLSKIAQKYGYYDQQEMSRRIKEAYNITPKELTIKKGYNKLPDDNKLSFDKLMYPNKEKTRLETIEENISVGFIGELESYVIESINECKKYGAFDEKIVRMIAELALEVDLDIDILFEEICSLVKDYEEYNNYHTEFDYRKKNWKNELLESKVEELGITPFQLILIAGKENCGTYEVTKEMVEKYKKGGKKDE
jgi:AraC-like DNA-binding protein